MNFLQRFSFIAIFCSFISLLYGCAAPSALNSKTKTLDLSQKSIVLATIEITRENNRVMPWPTKLQILPGGATSARELQSVSVDSEGMEYGEDSRRYVSLIRLALPPGSYSLSSLLGEVSAFPFKGSFQAPLGLAFEVPPQSVIYIGRVKLHMRSRNEGEFRAGPLFPLIAQGALGVSTSTFDISTEDASASDLPIFRENFPVLGTVDVKTQRLPAFKREVIDHAFMGTDSPTRDVNATKDQERQ
jgi:hypothetical protein